MELNGDITAHTIETVNLSSMTIKRNKQPETVACSTKE